MKKRLLIGLTGRAGAGKDTVANHFVRHHGFKIVRLSGPLKDLVAREFGLDRNRLEDFDYKEAPNDRCNAATPREVLIAIGQAFRAIDPFFWVRKAMTEAQVWERVVIPDVRHVNEFEAILTAGGEVWRVARKGGPTSIASMHPTESALIGAADDGETFESLGLAFIDEAHPDMLSIHISADQSTREAMETTMHEWAHALTMPWLQDWQNDHEDYFWIVFGRMYRRWHDQGGQEAAKRL